MIMCMQRVDLPRGVWNTRPMYIFEMAFKCGVFTMSGPSAVVAAVRTLATLTTSSVCLATASRTRCLLSSPFCHGLLVGCLFVVGMYPHMAKRAIGKLRGVLAGTVDATPPGAPLALQPGASPRSIISLSSNGKASSYPKVR